MPQISARFQLLFTFIVVFVILEFYFNILTNTKRSLHSIAYGKSENGFKEPRGTLITLLSENKWNEYNNSRTFLSNDSNVNFDSSKQQIITESTSTEIENNYTSTVPPCSDVFHNIKGRIPVIKTPIPSIKDLENKFPWVERGGHWQPQNCLVEEKVAIIIPFRQREQHLSLFLQHMHPFLTSQQLDYTIFVIEQSDKGSFNRGMLLNIGFKEAMNVDSFDCFILHDVDLLPEDDRNIYTCRGQPRHLSVAMDYMNYKLLYENFFGGVSAISTKHFKMLNGFSNFYWGWGGEDDDMFWRIKYHHLEIARYNSSIARYTMLNHQRGKPNPKRFKLLINRKQRYGNDGLNSLVYKIIKKQLNLLYTWILVDIKSGAM